MVDRKDDVEVALVAGFGPITRNDDESTKFWSGGLGIPLEEVAPGYRVNDALDGVRHFALWPLSQAAQATFETGEWPEEVPVPQAWIELDVASAEGVGEAVEELSGKGHDVLREAHEEPWGQTTARLLSPEGVLVGVTYTPWMH